jgi:hypothetical protein
VSLKPRSLLVDAAGDNLELSVLHNHLDESFEGAVRHMGPIDEEELKEAAILCVFVGVEVSIVNKHRGHGLS